MYDYTLVTDVDGLRDLYQALKSAEGSGFVGLDTEFYGPLQMWQKRKRDRVVDVLTSKLAGASFAVGNRAFYVVNDHVSTPSVPKDAFAKFFAEAQKLDLRWWCHSAYVELIALENYLGYQPRFARFGDSMILLHRCQAGLIRKGKKGDGLTASFGLKKVVPLHFGHAMAEFSDSIGDPILVSGPTQDDVAIAVAKAYMDELSKRGTTGAAVDRMIRVKSGMEKTQVWRDLQANEAPIDVFGRYAAEDAYWTLQLAEKLWPELEDLDYYDTWDSVDALLPYYQAAMYRSGVLIDQDFFARAERELRPKVDAWASDWETRTGAKINSSKQCVRALYGGDAPIWEPSSKTLTKTGSLSVGKDAIADILGRTESGSEANDLAKLKLSHAKASALLRRFETEIKAQLSHRSDGRIRSSFSFVGTDTGRISSSAPNMTNLPRPSDDPLTLRASVVAQPGYSIVSMDFSQLELVIMAHMSGSRVLCRALNDGKDMHAANAAAMGVSRGVAKTGVYAILYGGREKRVSEALGCTKEEAADFINSFYRANPEVAAFGDYTVKKLKIDGYAESLAKRRRYIPDIWAVENHNRSPQVLYDRAQEYLRKRGWEVTHDKVVKQAGVFARMDASGAERQAINFRIQGSASDIVLKTMADVWRFLDAAQWPVLPLLQVHDELVFEVRDDYVERFSARLTSLAESSVQLSVPLRCDTKVAKSYDKCK